MRAKYLSVCLAPGPFSHGNIGKKRGERDTLKGVAVVPLQVGKAVYSVMVNHKV